MKVTVLVPGLDNLNSSKILDSLTEILSLLTTPMKALEILVDLDAMILLLIQMVSPGQELMIISQVIRPALPLIHIEVEAEAGVGDGDFAT